MGATYLTVKWSTSRGRETYGYNICTVTDQETGKHFRCMGGGYDMLGTSIGEWIQDTYQDRLVAISNQAYMRRTENTGDKTGLWNQEKNDKGLYGMSYYVHSNLNQEKNDKGLYGMSYYVHSNLVVLDGACGINSIETIAKAIGVKLSRTWNQKGHTTGYVVTDE